MSWHWSPSMPPDWLWYISREYRKRTVPWNGLSIFLANMSVECRYSCLFHNKPWCFLTVDLHWLFQCTQERESFNFFSFKLISRKTLPWLLPAAVRGKQLKQSTTFIIAYTLKATSWINKLFYDSIYFKLIKSAGLMYFLDESSFRILFRYWK